VSGQRPERAVTLAVSRGVLGAGMLVMPPVVIRLAHNYALLAWSYQLAVGGAVSLLLALSVRGEAVPMSLASQAARVLGERAGWMVNAVFAVAFTSGQAAIAWFAAVSVTAGFDWPRWVALAVALGVILAALSVALSPLRLPPALLRARPWVTGLTAVACALWVWPSGPMRAALSPAALGLGAGFWLAVLALFFAGVGWEAVTQAVPGRGLSPGQVTRGVGLGVAVVAAAYLTIAALAGLRHTGPPASGWARCGLGVIVAIVLTSYCFTNIRTASGIAARLRPAWRPTGFLTTAVGALCLGFCLLGYRDGGIPILLLGPTAAAVTAYTAGAVAVLRQGPSPLRALAAVVLLALAAPVVLGVRALLPG
jgi:amino acid efflux transporter